MDNRATSPNEAQLSEDFPVPLARGRQSTPKRVFGMIKDDFTNIRVTEPYATND